MIWGWTRQAVVEVGTDQHLDRQGYSGQDQANSVDIRGGGGKSYQRPTKAPPQLGSGPGFVGNHGQVTVLGAKAQGLSEGSVVEARLKDPWRLHWYGQTVGNRKTPNPSSRDLRRGRWGQLGEKTEFQ